MNRRRAVAAFALMTLVGVVAPSALAAPGNLLLGRGRTEPIVAIDPARPSTIVVGSNTDYSAPVGDTFPTAYFTSHDGGRSFTFGNVPILRPYTTGADPSVQIAANGTVYYTYLGETPAYCSSGHSAVLLAASTDGGRSFRTPIVVDANSSDDKPSLAIENVSGRGAHLFVTWTRWLSRGSQIWYSRSTDGGRTFSAAAPLYASVLDNFGSVPAVGPRGHVYVFWSNFPQEALSAVFTAQLLVRASSDDGAHFGAAHRAAGPFAAIPQMVEPGSLRTLTAPAVAVARDGSVYLAWAAVSRNLGQGAVDANVDISRSQNYGASWSPPRRVNDVTHADRFMPSLSVLTDGSIGIAFYDRRWGSWDLGVYAARASFRGGFHTSLNVRVSRTGSPTSDIDYIRPGSTCLAPGRFFGDYIGTAASDSRTLEVVWADTQLHVASKTDVWFARVALPRP